MTQAIYPIPAFSDNYIWAFTDGKTRQACVVDPGDPQPVKTYLERNNLVLSDILVTHHHPDHTGGVEALASMYDAQVYGPASSPFKSVNHKLQEGDQVSVLGFDFSVLEVPGHTLDHIAYFCAADPATGEPLVFCGDTLFAAGCGRIFEGNPDMMYESLQKLAGLPDSTQVYCTHEYTLANLKFAAAAEPENKVLQERSVAAQKTREQDLPTLPSNIGLELATNPFLRCSDSSLICSASARTEARLTDPVTVFATLRQWKDNF